MTVQRLREALEDKTAQDAQAKAALAKSDAVILELRSSIRDLKGQLEDKNKEISDSVAEERGINEELQKQIQHLKQQLIISESSSKDANVGELQVQLDRAHAQILTADMVRKELEDTLEAEQYTWELRVQDSERQVAHLSQECDTLAQDLETCRSQWKEAEQGWGSQLEDLQHQLTQARTRIATSQALKAANSNSEELVNKILQLEKERGELQTCLDEALKELEAVDQELETDGKEDNVVESLQHLLRWILQEGKSMSSSNSSASHPNLHKLSNQPKELFSQIQDALEQWIQSTHEDPKSGYVEDLQSKLSVYQSELKAREEASAELRESLKEAVTLLKPLQDAVAKAEGEKQQLQNQVNQIKQTAESKEAQKQLSKKNRQILSLQEQVVLLQEQVKENKQLAAAREKLLQANTSNPSANTNNDDSFSKTSKAREDLRRKRETEGNMQQLLKDAQTRFRSLHQQNEEVAARNRELQGKLKDAKERLDNPLDDQLALYQQELAQKNALLKSLGQQLQQRQQFPPSQLQKELTQTRSELAQKEQAEQILNKSLKDALGLLRPLQMHLEEAESEKMEISKELRNLRKRFRQLQMGEGDDQTLSTMGAQSVSIEVIKIKEELEETVRQLELENSQLHDALEDLSDTPNAEAKLRQQFVELNKRYEVTQNKLEDAHVENHALVKTLKQKELEERQRKNELDQYKEKLQKAEAELSNAKAIARTALVKVEEITMANGLAAF